MGIKVGDKVRVVDTGEVYSDYKDFIDTYANENTKVWCKGKRISPGTIGTVVSINEHLDWEEETLVIVNTDNYSFIIGIEGLELVEDNDLCDESEYRTDISFEYTGRCSKMRFTINSTDYNARTETDFLNVICRDARGMLLVNDTLSFDETMALRDTLDDILDLHLEEKEENNQNVMKMSLKDIEEVLGYRIELI